jgi:Tfp pilus assembly protein PilE
MRDLRYHQKGVHLLDLIIAMLLIAVIALGSVPSLRALLHSNELQRQARLLKFRLETLLTDSLLYGHDTAATFGGTWYEIVPADNNKATIFQLPESITALLRSQNSQTIKFYKSGVTSPATIEISSKDKKCQLTLSVLYTAALGSTNNVA